MKLFENFHLGKVFHKDRVVFGGDIETVGYIDRYTLIEFKPIGGIILNVFKTKAPQNRFHTHGFPAFSIMLLGAYEEESLDDTGKVRKRVRRAYSKSDGGFPTLEGPVFLPRDLNHRIGKTLDTGSDIGAVSITLCGPWKKTWTETFWDDHKQSWTKVRTLGWGRKRIT